MSADQQEECGRVKKVWFSPEVCEVGLTVADARRLLRGASEVAVTVTSIFAVSKNLTLYVPASVIRRDLKWRKPGDYFPIERDIHGNRPSIAGWIR